MLIRVHKIIGNEIIIWTHVTKQDYNITGPIWAHFGYKYTEAKYDCPSFVWFHDHSHLIMIVFSLSQVHGTTIPYDAVWSVNIWLVGYYLQKVYRLVY